MQGDKPNYFQGHRICMDQNNSLQLNKSQLKLVYQKNSNIADSRIQLGKSNIF